MTRHSVSLDDWHREREDTRLQGREAHYDNPDPDASLSEIVTQATEGGSTSQWARGWLDEHRSVKCSCGASIILCDAIHGGAHVTEKY